jgi:hypothetical protein
MQDDVQGHHTKSHGMQLPGLAQTERLLNSQEPNSLAASRLLNVKRRLWAT